MTNNLPHGIVYISKNKLTVYVQDSPTLFTLEFKPTYVRDLEIINEDELNKELKLFIETNKLPPSDIGLVLADSLLFEKKLTVPPADIEKEIKKYLEDIPFEDSSYQIVNVSGEIDIVVANALFYMLFITAFETLGFTVQGVIPAKVVSAQFASSDTIDVNSANFLSGKFTSYLGFNFIKPIIENKEDTTEIHTNEKPPKSHEKMLIGVFISLVVVMCVMYYLIYLRKPAKKPILPPPPRVVSPVVVTRVPAFPTATIVLPSLSVMAPAQIPIEIRSSSTSSLDTANRLKNILSQKGFTDISLITTDKTTAQNIIVVFSNKIDKSMENTIMEEAQKIGPVTSQETEVASLRVVITVPDTLP